VQTKQAFCFSNSLRTAKCKLNAEWREPPARLSAGLEGIRLQANRRPAARRRAPNAARRLLSPQCTLSRLFLFIIWNGLRDTDAALLHLAVMINTAAGQVGQLYFSNIVILRKDHHDQVADEMW